MKPASDVDLAAGKKTLVLVYIARFIRAFAFGAVSVIFALYLLDHQFSSLEIGSIVSATLVEDALLTAVVAIFAARIGLRLLLLLGALILSLSGFLFAYCTFSWAIVLVSIFSIISPSGYEGGPFGALEQSIISESAKSEELAHAFSRYNLIAFAGSAFGSLLTGMAFPLISQAYSKSTAFSWIFLAYAVAGLLMLLLYAGLNERSLAALKDGEPAPEAKKSSAIRSPQIWRLAILQGLDAFGGGFIPATLISYWFFERYHAGPEFTGPVFFLTNALAAASFLLAPHVCRRFGLLNTMVFTHLPCSLALCLVPLMPTAFLAGVILVARSLFSSMDIPARQAFSMVLVAKEDRTTVAGLTSAARSIGQCAAPLVSGWALANTLSGLSFQLAGGIKTFYDLCIYACFRKVPLQSEES